MAFVLILFPSVRQIARVANDAAGDPLGQRILEQHAHGMRIALDEGRSAYLFQVNATGRHNSLQVHYMLFCHRRFFHVRTRAFTSSQVCFYGFPSDCEAERSSVQNCFREAVQVFGWFGDTRTPDENALFVPEFGPDDWEPPGL